MFKLLIDTYSKIAEETYYPFEIHHMNQAQKHIDSSVSIRDVMMLSAIEFAKTPLNPSKLAKNFSLANNVISNRLALFEESGFITRTRYKEDQRNVELNITNKGKEIVFSYTNYVNTFLKHLKKSLTPLDYLTMNSVIKKLTVVIQDVSHTDDDTLSSDFFMRLHKYFNSFDLKLIKELNYDLKINDLIILTEYYIQTLRKTYNLTTLSSKILIPYQTLVSKMNKLHELHLLKHDETSHFVLSESAIHIVQNFMTNRIIVFYQTTSSFNEKETSLTIKIFKSLKDYVI